MEGLSSHDSVTLISSFTQIYTGHVGFVVNQLTGRRNHVTGNVPLTTIFFFVLNKLRW